MTNKKDGQTAKATAKIRGWLTASIPPFAMRQRRIGHPICCGWWRKAKTEADSSASLRNDKQKGRAKAKAEADSSASLRNDKQKRRARAKATADSSASLRNDNKKDGQPTGNEGWAAGYW
jgi:hypothetical protein